jgi:hypothetical protein
VSGRWIPFGVPPSLSAPNLLDQVESDVGKAVSELGLANTAASRPDTADGTGDLALLRRASLALLIKAYLITLNKG